VDSEGYVPLAHEENGEDDGCRLWTYRLAYRNLSLLSVDRTRTTNVDFELFSKNLCFVVLKKWKKYKKIGYAHQLNCLLDLAITF